MEKLARVRGLATVTRAVALEITGEGQSTPAATPVANGHETDATLTWTPEAEQRLARVPAGFMRHMTRARVENLARDKGLSVVTLDTAEAAIGLARQQMQETVGAYMRSSTPA
jgi:hypothetical protein